MVDSRAEFKIGQIVVHKLFEYTGVIFDIDPNYQGSEEWYKEVAMSLPPKDKPWYHVLVNGEEHTTYVSERNIEDNSDPSEIQHPLVNVLFDKFDGKQYHLKFKSN